MRVLIFGIALCIGSAGCSVQPNSKTPPTPGGDIKTTELRDTAMTQRDRDLKERELKEQMKEKKLIKNKLANSQHTPLDGTIIHYDDFPSELVRPRPVDVWLPEGYDHQSNDRYPVIYMHDGQFLFDQSDSPFAGMDLLWDVDKAITRLVRDGDIRPAIVVSIWMSHWAKGARGAEYMPQKPVTDDVWQLMVAQGNNFSVEAGGEVMSSDNYLKFIVNELKPFIDQNYRTKPDRSNTFVAGSSMGGLISAYAIAEYPEVFGGAACLSTHWPIGDGIVVQWLGDHWPTAGAHRVYFDHGTETLDADYAPYQRSMDEVMRRHGYTDSDWVTRRFEGANHSPQAWRERLHIPLKFLLGTP